MTKGDEVAQFIIQQRGYIVVVGFQGWGAVPSPGQRLTVFADMPLSQPVVVVAETDGKDWMDQMRCAAPRFQSDPEVPRAKSTAGGRYFKCNTD
jgi:hypothetical protein